MAIIIKYYHVAKNRGYVDKSKGKTKKKNKEKLQEKGLTEMKLPE